MSCVLLSCKSPGLFVTGPFPHAPVPVCDRGQLSWVLSAPPQAASQQPPDACVSVCTTVGV